MEERKSWLEKFFFETVMDSFYTEFILQVARESLVEGREAKIAAEKISGLIFPNPPWMQHSTYTVIRDLWKDRKVFLKRQIEMRMQAGNKAEAAKKVREDPETATKKLEEKKRRKVELLRQRKLCAEMAAEELLCKKFYQWEFAQNLRERRLMREEDETMRRYVKELERIAKLGDSAYAVSAKELEEQQRRAMETVCLFLFCSHTKLHFICTAYKYA